MKEGVRMQLQPTASLTLRHAAGRVYTYHVLVDAAIDVAARKVGLGASK